MWLSRRRITSRSNAGSCSSVPAYPAPNPVLESQLTAFRVSDEPSGRTLAEAPNPKEKKAKATVNRRPIVPFRSGA